MDSNAVELERLIVGILTPNEVVQKQAQDTYYQILNSNPTHLFRSLGVVLKHSQSHNARLFSAVILRQQSLPNKDTMDKVDPVLIVELKALAMDLFQNEANDDIRRKVIEFAAMFASHLFKRSQSPNPADAWPEILQLTCHGASLAAQPAIQASCFDMLAQIGEYAVTVFNGQETMLINLLSQSINATTPIDVAISASCAALSILTSYSHLHTQLTTPGQKIDENIVGGIQNAIAIYSTAIPSICQLFARALNEQCDHKLRPMLSLLSTTIHAQPKAFASCFSDLVSLVVMITKHPDLEPSFRERSLLLLTRFGDSAAGRALCRKTPSYQSNLMSIGFEFLMDVDYTKEWAQDPVYGGQGDEDDWPNYHLGLYIMSELPNILGVKATLTPLLKEIMGRAGQMSNWKNPHAALSVLHILCQNHLNSFPKPAIEGLRQMLVQLTKPAVTSKTNPRATVMVLQATASFITKINQKTGKDLITNILAMLPPDINLIQQIPPTMVWQSVWVLACLCGLLTADNLKPYLDKALAAISTLLSHPLSSVRNVSLTALAAVALQLNVQFEPYADAILKALCESLQSANVQLEQYIQTATWKSDEKIEKSMTDLHSVRNKTIDTIAIIAEALGHDLFMKYAPSIMTLITAAQELEQHYHNPSYSFVFSAFTRLANTLNTDFGPFLAPIIPGILRAAAVQGLLYRFDLDPEGNLSPQDSPRVDELEQRGFISQIVNVHGQGSERVVIHPQAVQDKCQALELLGDFAISLREAFGPFLRETAQVLFPECSTTKNPRIRWSAATTLPALLECLYTQDGVSKETVLGFFTEIINAYSLPVWVQKELPEGLGTLIQSTTACIDAVHQAGITQLPNELLQVLSNAFLEGWKLCLERRLSIEQEVLTGDEESVELRSEAMQIENTALDALIAMNTELIRTARDQYWPFFVHSVEPLFASAIGPDNEALINGKAVKRDPYLNVCAVIGYADSIAASKGLGVNLIAKVFPIFMSGALDAEDPELRRGAAYGLTACHRALPMTDFAQFVASTAEVLAKSSLIEYDPPETEEYNEDYAESALYALDNALSGLTDIMVRFGCGFPLESSLHSEEEQKNFNSIANLIDTSYMSKYMPVVLSKLPIFHDEEEARHTHANLATWFRKCPQSVYGENNQNIPDIVRIVAHVLDLEEEYDIISPEDLETLRDVWRNLRTQLPPEILVKLVGAIDPDFAPHLKFE